MGVASDPNAWRRALVTLCAANFLTAVGMMAFLPFFPLYLRELGVTDPAAVTLWSGVLVGAAPFSAAVMGGVWGSIGDQIGRRKMVLRALLGITVFVSAMAAARSPWALLLLRFGQGTFSGFLAPTLTLVSVLAPPERQGRVSGTLQTAVLAGGVVGPIVGGALATRAGFAGTALTCAALSLVAAATVRWLVPEPPIARERSTERFGRRVLGVLGRVRRELGEALLHPVLRPLFLVLFLTRLAVAALNPTLLLHVERLSGEVGDAAARLGSIVFSANPLAVILALPFWGKLADRRDPWRVLRFCVVFGAVLTAAQAAARTPVEFGVLRFLAGVFLAGVFPAGFALVAGASDPSRRGGTTGLAFSALAFGLALGPWTCAVIDAWLGYRVLLLVCGALLGLAALRLVLVTPAVRARLRGAPPAASGP